MNIEQLLEKSGRWPWRWTKFGHATGQACETLRLLKEEHHLLKIDFTELGRQRIADAEKHQNLRDDHQLLKCEMTEMKKQHLKDTETATELRLKIENLERERDKLLTQHGHMKDGVSTLFEFIRRSKGIDDTGKSIPNIFRR